MGDDENKNNINGLYGVDRDKQDAFPDTVWSKEPHKGTVWQNENKSRASPQDKKEQDNRSWTEKSKDPNGRGGGGGKGGRFLLSIVFAIIFINVVMYGHAAIAGTIDSAFIGQNWESTHHFLQQWLGLGTKVFLHISTLIVVIVSFIALGKNFLGYMAKGAMFVIMTGLLAFFATFLYLVATGIFFGK